MIVYKITNKINGKIYIGQTEKVDITNYYGSGVVIMKALKKYGKKNFERIILEVCQTKDQLNKAEIYWIEYYNSTDRNLGYNISTGGDGGNLGDLVNERLSKKAKNQVVVKDNCGNKFRVDRNDPRFISGELVGIAKGNIAHNRGVPMSEEQKQKLRKPKTEEHKQKCRDAQKLRSRKKIICLNNGVVYDSMAIAAEVLNLTIPNIIAVLKGRAKATKGYAFKYYP